jgi:hypothetical protein
LDPIRALRRGSNGTSGIAQNNVGGTFAWPGNAEPAKRDKLPVGQAAKRTGKAGAAGAGFLSRPANCSDRNKLDRFAG